MNGRPEVVIDVDLARVEVPAGNTGYIFKAGYGERVMIYVIRETGTDGHTERVVVIEDGGEVEMIVRP